MPGFIEIMIRTITAFCILWVFVHLLGKQTIAQRTYHLYIASITMGTIGGNLAFNIKIKFLYFIISIFLMGSIVYVLNMLSVRSIRLRKWIAGEPVILIQEGKILEESMKRMGYSLDSLIQALRVKDIFNLEEVECAILELNGSLSVLKKSHYRGVTLQDLRVQSSPVRMPIELIYEGRMVQDHFLHHIYDQEWLEGELKKRNLLITDVSYAVVGTKGNLYIDLFHDQ